MGDFRPFFKNKRVTVMGLGLLGRGAGDAAFLAEYGAKLTITDLKTKEQLKESLEKLKKFKNITYVLGRHRLEDFRNKDMIIKNPDVRPGSIYIKEAKKHYIPVEMSATLFVKLSGIPIIGVTGTRGKSTVAHLIAHILRSAGKKAILGGNVRGVSNLQLLKEVKHNSVAVLELDSWQLRGFGGSRISPNISVFTTFFPDHFGYYKGSMKKYFFDKSHIFMHQKGDDLLIIGRQSLPFIKKWGGEIKSRMIVPPERLPRGWKFHLPGLHNEYNARLAMEVAGSLSISDAKIKKALETFRPLQGRLQYVRSINGIKIYNDNSSTTPEATIAAIRAVGDRKKRNVVLIIGGDKKFLDMSHLIKEIPKYCSKVVLFKEKGTDLIRDSVLRFKKRGIDVYEEEGIYATVHRAFNVSKAGETILYSPAFSSFGKYFENEYDRGDQFMKIVDKMK